MAKQLLVFGHDTPFRLVDGDGLTVACCRPAAAVPVLGRASGHPSRTSSCRPRSNSSCSGTTRRERGGGRAARVRGREDSPAAAVPVLGQASCSPVSSCRRRPRSSSSGSGTTTPRQARRGAAAAGWGWPGCPSCSRSSARPPVSIEPTSRSCRPRSSSSCSGTHTPVRPAPVDAAGRRAGHARPSALPFQCSTSVTLAPTPARVAPDREAALRARARRRRSGSLPRCRRASGVDWMLQRLPFQCSANGFVVEPERVAADREAALRGRARDAAQDRAGDAARVRASSVNDHTGPAPAGGRLRRLSPPQPERAEAASRDRQCVATSARSDRKIDSGAYQLRSWTQHPKRTRPTSQSSGAIEPYDARPGPTGAHAYDWASRTCSRAR